MSCLLFHNWETFDDRTKVKNTLIQYFLDNGFTKQQGYKGTFDRFSNGQITIKEYSFCDWDTLDGIIPYTCVTKVCVDCGKIKLTYDIKKCIKKLQEIIVDKTKEYNKRKKAEDILNEQRTS